MFEGLDEADKLELQGRGEDLLPILRALPGEGVSDVLDVGCGSGVLTRALARHWAGRTNVWGMDCSDTQVQYARHIARRERVPSVGFLVGDILNPPPHLRGAFDLVLCRYVLMYMVPRKQAHDCLRRMASLVRPGGHVVCIEADVNFGQERYPAPPEPLAWVLANVVEFYRVRGLIEWRCGVQLFAHMKAVGLNEVKVSLVDGRIIQGGSPPSLVQHDARTVEQLVEPILASIGKPDMVDEVAQQWRSYLGDRDHFLYTPVFVAQGTVAP